MMKQYDTPKMNVFLVEEDIVTTSGVSVRSVYDSDDFGLEFRDLI